MDANGNKHKNYEILNLIGYGMSKFNDDFLNEFGFSTKSAFYKFCIKNGIAETVGTIKNRMDMFDNFFPDSGRKGWWQKGNTYIHRKIHIDSLFGDEDAKGYANVVKLYMQENYKIKNIVAKESPIIKSRFKKMQETGLEAEVYFQNNYESIDIFKGGKLEDARLYGDGYDFQINISEKFLLTEVKGVRGKSGSLRLTENEYKKAKEYRNDYILSVVLNLNELPILRTISNPAENLEFKKVEIISKAHFEYQLVSSV